MQSTKEKIMEEFEKEFRTKNSLGYYCYRIDVDPKKLITFLSSSLDEMAKAAKREVVEETSLGDCPYGGGDEEADGWFEAEKRLSFLKQSLRAKHNLDK